MAKYFIWLPYMCVFGVKSDRLLANKTELKAAKKQRQADYVQRIPIEGKFGQGKSGYGLNRIKAKTAKTSYAWDQQYILSNESIGSIEEFFAVCSNFMT